MTLDDMSSHVKSFSQILNVKSCQVMSMSDDMSFSDSPSIDSIIKQIIFQLVVIEFRYPFANYQIWPKGGQPKTSLLSKKLVKTPLSGKAAPSPHPPTF